MPRTTQPVAGGSRLHALWDDLDRPLAGRRVPGTVPVALVAGVIALVASAFLVPSGFSLAYSDAQSHLTIARRLFDTRSNPGLVQLGTVWLPAPHLLLAPFAASLWLWRTGWGAALLGAVCLGVAAAGLYRASARWGAGRSGRLTAVGVLVLNPTMLYLTSTALTEPVLIASIAMCLAGLANFTTRSRLSSPGEVAIFCGIPAALASLSRYEGWALALTGAVLVGVATWRRTRGDLHRSAASMLGFVVPPLLAMAWWVGFNWVVFHNPLEFLTGQFSANAQQAGIVAAGTSTRLNAETTIRTLNVSVTTSVGLISLALAAIGLITALTIARARNRFLFIVTASSSYLFLCVALYTGQAIIWNDAINSTYIWNNRFGMSSVLPTALLAAVAAEALPQLVTHHRLSILFRRAIVGTNAAVIAALVVGQALWFLQAPSQRSLVITEASVSWAASADPRQAASWLRTHYDGGDILMDETVSANAVLPQIGIPLRHFYLQADDSSFRQALADPAAHTRWVWSSTSSSDKVAQVTREPDFSGHYEQVFRNSTTTIFRRTGN